MKEQGFKLNEMTTPPRWEKRTDYGMLSVTLSEGYITVRKWFEGMNRKPEIILKGKIE